MAVDVVSDNTLQMSPSGQSTMELVDPVSLPDGRVLALPIPNATAMLLHASKRAYEDAQNLLGGDLYKIDPRDIFRMRNSAEAVDVAEYLALSVFAAYTSLECFANEWTYEKWLPVRPRWLVECPHDRKDLE